ncbi:hypothetical protein KIW84_055017 [Lathyrus oleraceus]|uniref:Uncharacterized protein n=1 Tax=Pisum sativum TaxID=3888 RepID=A0A9D5AJ86_PEA|nr:hypothetical protein KIW84_055017 [Pisum sativum]
MIVSAPNDFTDMVNMGMRLEEGVREGNLSKDEASSNKRYGSNFGKKKDSEANAISSGRQRRPQTRRNQPSLQHHHQVSSVIPVFSNNQSASVQQQQRQQQQPQQRTNTYNKSNTNNNHHQQNFERNKVSFDLIPMSYAELYPSLVLRNLIQPRNPPQIPEPLPWWYKPELRCAFHQGAPGHDIDNCYPLKYEVQKLMKCGMVSFEDRAPNVKANPLPAHGKSYVNMVDGCPVEFKVFEVHFIWRFLVQMHKDICLVSDCEHDHDGCVVCSINSRDDDVNVIVPNFKHLERLVIQYDSSNSNNVSNKPVSSLVIRLAGPVPYSSDKALSYQYNATMIEGGQEVPLPTASSVVSIIDVTKVTRSGRVFGSVFPKDKKESVVGKKVEVPVVYLIGASKGKYGESSDLKANGDDERSTAESFGTSICRTRCYSGSFDHIVANITSCNNLSFCDKELPEEGRNHNLALHIPMNCKDDALSNVLVDTGSSLNVLSKSTLSKLSYQGTPMRYSSVILKAFDDSHKTVIGEVDLLLKIGPSDFKINFKVIDIHPAYSCLLGRPWIHEAEAVASILHQKLKFVKNGKLVIVGGEKALLVSHLSSFSYVEAEDEVGTPLKALSITTEKRVGAPMSSLKDARNIIEEGNVDQWGRMVEVSDNKGRTGLGFQ